MSEQPLVSIIMPTYNSENHLKQSVLSIIAQTYSNWELLITDDCSSDKTVGLLQELEKEDTRIKCFYFKTNKGADKARNNSIQYAKGEYIAFCDSDDLWLSNKLEVQIEFMIKNKISMSYTNLKYCDEKGDIIGSRACLSRVNYGRLLYGCNIVCSSIVYSTSSLGKVYMPHIRKRQDWALWLKILKEIDYAYNVGEYLIMYRNSQGSISSNKFDLIKYNWAVYRKIEGFSFFKSIYYFTIYMLVYAYEKSKKKLSRRAS